MLQFCLFTYPPRSKWTSSEKMTVFAKIGNFCKSIAGPLPSVAKAYTQPYSLGGIICQISHEVSITIHEIITCWKKTLNGGSNINENENAGTFKLNFKLRRVHFSFPPYANKNPLEKVCFFQKLIFNHKTKGFGFYYSAHYIALYSTAEKESISKSPSCRKPLQKKLASTMPRVNPIGQYNGIQNKILLKKTTTTTAVA